MNIIVFGGSGFLGSHVSDKLSEIGHNVSIYDIQNSKYLRKDQTMILGDILDEKKVKEAIQGHDVVYNFAGYADLDTASTSPRNTTELNLIGNINIIEGCIASKVNQFVYASTIYVFSEAGGFYRCSKQAAEIYLEEYHNRYGMNYTILRFGSLYGPRSDERNSIYKYLKKALYDGKIKIKASGHEIREYIHVRDASKISARILAPEYYNKRFVLTGHQAIPVSQMLKMIQEIVKNPVEIEYEDADSGSDKVGDHYEITPYSFVPKVGEKFSPELYTDMGQGLIETIADIESRENPVYYKK
ncbi:MAG: NAD(P)-dependent oxidoreductase [Spirochaetia bacterium]|nr:NAD(P)-dependent oxidoreductase [Spirochaetia bacterium]